MKSYIMPASVTWWASFVPLALGIFVAAEPLHGLEAWVAFVNNATGHMHPAVMINAGIAGIGLRKAIG